MKRFVYTFFCGFFFGFLALTASAQGVSVPWSGVNVPLFSFGVIADCQYCDCPQNGLREYASSPRKLRECIDVFNERDLSFVISLGDLINSGLSSYDSMFSIIKKLEHPFRFVYGNHDFIGSASIDQTIMRNLGLRKRYYSFRQDGFRFIVLDSNDIGLAASPTGSAQYQKTLLYIENLKSVLGSNTNTSNGAVGEVQIKWLKNELVEAQKLRERVIVCNHMPTYNLNSTHILWNNRLVAKVLQESPQVEAYFCGHVHEGNYIFFNKIHFLNFIGMVDTPYNAYSIVHVYNDRLEVEGFGREPNRSLVFATR